MTLALRPYQEAAIAAVKEKLEAHRSTVLVMPTGTGKTATFTAIVKNWPGRALVLAHRDELLQQAQKRIEADTGRPVDLEQAGFHASTLYQHTVVGSVQSMRGPRLARWKPDAFSLIVVDECHHAAARSYRKILEHFAPAKVLGVTATPDRGDGIALGGVFDSVAYEYAIEDAINDGYLCGVKVRTVHVAGLRLAAVKTTAGDLNQGELDDVMRTEENLHAVAKPTMELAGERRTIVFTTSVDAAHRMAEVFNRYRAGSARAVDGETPRDERRALLADHQRGAFQYLVNVGIATEGYDDPAVSCIAMGRPTKSRALYAQMAGRGLRIAEGKADCLILDFAGNAGKHTLVSAHDILAGKYPDEVVKRAKKNAEAAGEADVRASLTEAEQQLRDEARERLIAERAKVRAESVDYTTEEVDPFGVLDAYRPPIALRYDPPTPWHREFCRKRGIPLPKTRVEANSLVQAAMERDRRGLCTYRQAQVLRRYGYRTDSMTSTAATTLLREIAANGGRTLPREKAAQILGAA